MEQPSSHTFRSDFRGRISNISLAPSPNNSLAPLFEAITNAIQAVEDKFGKDNLTKGVIEIDVVRTPDEPTKSSGFIIRDNGIGFNEDNLKSFLTSDSRYKIERGGKGVGRFLWLKVFEKTRISSQYDSDGFKEIAFDFVLDGEDQVRDLTISESSGPTGSSVELRPFHPEYAAHCPSRTSTIRNKIISHFLSYFINMHAPSIFVIDEGIKDDLFDMFTNAVSDDREYSFDVPLGEDVHKFSLHAFLLPKKFSDDEKGNNAIYYGAHSRTVERHDMDKALGLKQIEGGKVYFGFVESKYLNEIVNLERTHLSWPPEFFDDVHRKAIDRSKDFLSEPIKKIRRRQAETVAHVRNEHLRFLSVAENAEEFAKQLPLSVQRPEDIYLELSRLSLRRYNRKKRSFNEAKTKKLPDFDEKAREYAKQLKSESISSLAEYVLKRKLILEVFEDRLKFKNVGSESHYFEEAVHEIICPLGETTDTLNYEDHNLWIVDDSLAFYTYFASDKTLKSTTGGADTSTQEPDIAIFDLGLGFNQAGSLEPISIIEFKRPGRNDYTLQKNPFVQVREYVTRLRKAGVARAADGSEVRQIEENTPFLCFVIADIESTLKSMMQQFGPFHRRAGHGSYYKWDENYKIFIEVTSYSEILRGAKARHQAFFERLGINP